MGGGHRRPDQRALAGAEQRRGPVIAIGGFTGSDPAPTLAEFRQLAAAPEIHYFVAMGGGGAGGTGGGSGYGSQITAWVKQHFPARTVGGMAVYDLTKA